MRLAKLPPSIPAPTDIPALPSFPGLPYDDPVGIYLTESEMEAVAQRIAREELRGSSKAMLVAGSIVAWVIVGIGALSFIFMGGSGPGGLGLLFVGFASPFIALIAKGLFACVALVLALIESSRAGVIRSLLWIGAAIVVALIGVAVISAN